MPAKIAPARIAMREFSQPSPASLVSETDAEPPPEAERGMGLCPANSASPTASFSAASFTREGA